MTLKETNSVKKTHTKFFVLVLFVLLFILGFFFSLGNGAVKIGPVDIIRGLLGDADGTNFQIIWNVRLPRTIVAALVGISLSLSGVILQGIMRNPLAGPNIIGVSAGGGFFGIAIMILFPDLYYLVPFGAFLGALSATLLIYKLAYKEGASPTRLVLAGVAISSLFSSGTNTLMTFFPDRVEGVLSFMVGGLSAITWMDVKQIFPFTLLGIFAIFFMPNKLNILMLGDEVATGLGVKVEKARFVLIIISSILAGASVSVVGMLGFVGLIVPHMARLFIGSDYRFLILATVFLGGGIVMICDTLARILFIPMEIPVGIIMSVLGAPFFLYLLRTRKEYKQ